MMKKKILGVIVLFSSCLFLVSCISINVGSGKAVMQESVIRQGSAEKILLIKVDGVILDAPQKNMFGAEEPPITARIKDELIRAEKDKSVRGILLRINSPGGAVTACDIIRDELVKFRKRTGVPIIAEMGDIAASGGVYISTAADKIIAHPTTVTGSIGVIMQMYNAKDLFEKIGVKSETIKSGDKKDMGSPFRGLSAEERSLFQDVNTSLYERFLSMILDGRKGINEQKLREIADGRIFVAQKALEYGLIDKIGYDDDSIILAEQITGVKNATIITYTSSGRNISNIYSKAALQNSGTINLVNIQASFLDDSHGVSFMYMMQ
jgi:protease-4